MDGTLMTPLSRFDEGTTLEPTPTPARAIAAGRQMLLTTSRRNGARVPTAEGTAKISRLRRNPHVTIQACDLQGPRPDGTRRP